MGAIAVRDHARGWGGLHGVDLHVRGGLLVAAETEQGLERSYRGPSPVEPEDELIEVDLQMLGECALVGALQPTLEVADGPADPRRDVVEVLDRDPAGLLSARVVFSRA